MKPLEHNSFFEKKEKLSATLVSGVNGVGKTTTIGKIGKIFKTNGNKVMFAASDTFRAAAIEQLENWANRINVQNQYNLTQSALSQLWQKYRDNAAWNFQKSESALQRQHEIGVMAMEFANTKELYDKEMKDSIATGVGNWLGTWIREA